MKKYSDLDLQQLEAMKQLVFDIQYKKKVKLTINREQGKVAVKMTAGKLTQKMLVDTKQVDINDAVDLMEKALIMSLVDLALEKLIK